MPNQSVERSLQGVLELSLFSSQLHVLVCMLQAGQLSLSGSVFLLEVSLCDAVTLLYLKVKSTYLSQKHLTTKRQSLPL